MNNQQSNPPIPSKYCSKANEYSPPKPQTNKEAAQKDDALLNLKKNPHYALGFVSQPQSQDIVQQSQPSQVQPKNDLLEDQNDNYNPIQFENIHSNPSDTQIGLSHPKTQNNMLKIVKNVKNGENKDTQIVPSDSHINSQQKNQNNHPITDKVPLSDNKQDKNIQDTTKKQEKDHQAPAQPPLLKNYQFETPKTINGGEEGSQQKDIDNKGQLNRTSPIELALRNTKEPSEIEKQDTNVFYTVKEFIVIGQKLNEKIKQISSKLKYSFLKRLIIYKPLVNAIKSDEEFDSKIEKLYVQCVKDLMINSCLHQRDALIDDYIKEWGKCSQKYQNVTLSANAEQPSRTSDRIFRKINQSSLQHALKRIQKAAQIKVEEFLLENKPFDSLTGPDQQKQEINDVYIKYMKRYIKDYSENCEQNKKDDAQAHAWIERQPKIVAIMQDLIQIERQCKINLELIDQKFVPLLNNYGKEIADVLFDQDDNANAQYDSKESQTAKQSLVQIQAKVEQEIPKKDSSSIFDIFEDYELKEAQKILLISILEVGNTIDGIIIANKMIRRYGQISQLFQNHEAQLNQQVEPAAGPGGRFVYIQNLSVFLDWQKRNCHGCMEYILDAGKAVICANVIIKKGECQKIYCQNCVIQFYEYKFQLNLRPVDGRSSKSIADSKQLKQKLWQRACQNILFICPCCQNQCLTSCLKQSVCNINYKIKEEPAFFLNKYIYYFFQKSFVLAKIIFYNKLKKAYNIEIINDTNQHQYAGKSSQYHQQADQQYNYQSQSRRIIYHIDLLKEQFFFKENLREGSRLFTMAQEQEYTLNIKQQIETQTNDFQKYGDYEILQRYAKYLDGTKSLMDPGFILKINESYQTQKSGAPVAQQVPPQRPKVQSLAVQDICQMYSKDRQQFVHILVQKAQGQMESMLPNKISIKIGRFREFQGQSQQTNVDQQANQDRPKMLLQPGNAQSTSPENNANPEGYHDKQARFDGGQTIQQKYENLVKYNESLQNRIQNETSNPPANFQQQQMNTNNNPNQPNQQQLKPQSQNSIFKSYSQNNAQNLTNLQNMHQQYASSNLQKPLSQNPQLEPASDLANDPQQLKNTTQQPLAKEACDYLDALTRQPDAGSRKQIGHDQDANMNGGSSDKASEEGSRESKEADQKEEQIDIYENVMRKQEDDITYLDTNQEKKIEDEKRLDEPQGSQEKQIKPYELQVNQREQKKYSKEKTSDSILPQKRTRNLPRAQYTDNQHQLAVFNQTVPVLTNVEELEDIEKQLERQFKKIDVLNRCKQAKFGWADKEEKRRQERIEKKIDQLLKQKDKMISEMTERNRQSQELEELQRQKQKGENIVNKLDLYDEQSDSIEPADNPGDYDGKKAWLDVKPFKPTEIKLLAADELQYAAANGKEPIFIKRFRQGDDLKQHCQFMRQLAKQYPTKLENLFVYIHEETGESDVWCRMLIKSYRRTSQKFECECWGATKSTKRLRLAQQREIVIDQQQFTTKPGCQYLRFNDKRRVQTLLRMEQELKRRMQSSKRKVDKIAGIDQMLEEDDDAEALGQQKKRRKQDNDDQSENNRSSSVKRNLDEIVNEIIQSKAQQNNETQNDEESKEAIHKNTHFEQFANNGDISHEASSNKSQKKIAKNKYIVKIEQQPHDGELNNKSKKGIEKLGEDNSSTVKDKVKDGKKQKRLIFKANFADDNQKSKINKTQVVEQLKDQWVHNMNAKTLRTKIKNKGNRKLENNNTSMEQDSNQQQEDGNQGKKLLKFFYQDIDSEDADGNRSVNIMNANSVKALHEYYTKIIHQFEQQNRLQQLLNQVGMQQQNGAQGQGLKIDNHQAAFNPNFAAQQQLLQQQFQQRAAQNGLPFAANPVLGGLPYQMRQQAMNMNRNNVLNNLFNMFAKGNKSYAQPPAEFNPVIAHNINNLLSQKSMANNNSFNLTQNKLQKEQASNIDQQSKANASNRQNEAEDQLRQVNKAQDHQSNETRNVKIDQVQSQNNKKSRDQKLMLKVSLCNDEEKDGDGKQGGHGNNGVQKSHENKGLIQQLQNNQLPNSQRPTALNVQIDCENQADGQAAIKDIKAQNHRNQAAQNIQEQKDNANRPGPVLNEQENPIDNQDVQAQTQNQQILSNNQNQVHADSHANAANQLLQNQRIPTQQVYPPYQAPNEYLFQQQEQLRASDGVEELRHHFDPSTNQALLDGNQILQNSLSSNRQPDIQIGHPQAGQLASMHNLRGEGNMAVPPTPQGQGSQAMRMIGAQPSSASANIPMNMIANLSQQQMLLNQNQHFGQENLQRVEAITNLQQQQMQTDMGIDGNQAQQNNMQNELDVEQQQMQQLLRKCNCEVCATMDYPELIRNDENSIDFVSEHRHRLAQTFTHQAEQLYPEENHLLEKQDQYIRNQDGEITQINKELNQFDGQQAEDFNQEGLDAHKNAQAQQAQFDNINQSNMISEVNAAHDSQQCENQPSNLNENAHLHQQQPQILQKDMVNLQQQDSQLVNQSKTLENNQQSQFNSPEENLQEVTSQENADNGEKNLQHAQFPDNQLNDGAAKFGGQHPYQHLLEDQQIKNDPNFMTQNPYLNKFSSPYMSASPFMASEYQHHLNDQSLPQNHLFNAGLMHNQHPSSSMPLSMTHMMPSVGLDQRFNRYHILSTIQKMQQSYIYKQMLYEQDMDSLKQAQMTLTEQIQRCNLQGLLKNTDGRSSANQQKSANLAEANLSSDEQRDLNLVKLMQSQQDIHMLVLKLTTQYQELIEMEECITQMQTTMLQQQMQQHEMQRMRHLGHMSKSRQYLRQYMMGHGQAPMHPQQVKMFPPRQPTTQMQSNPGGIAVNPQSQYQLNMRPPADIAHQQKIPDQELAQNMQVMKNQKQNA